MFPNNKDRKQGCTALLGGLVFSCLGQRRYQRLGRGADYEGCARPRRTTALTPSAGCPPSQQWVCGKSEGEDVVAEVPQEVGGLLQLLSSSKRHGNGEEAGQGATTVPCVTVWGADRLPIA